MTIKQYFVKFFKHNKEEKQELKERVNPILERIIEALDSNIDDDDFASGEWKIKKEIKDELRAERILKSDEVLDEIWKQIMDIGAEVNKTKEAFLVRNSIYIKELKHLSERIEKLENKKKYVNKKKK